MTDKSETTLSVDFTLIKERVGRVLGLPDDIATWTQRQMTSVLNCIKDGFRQYYQPPAVDDYGAHQWSFMYPVTTMKTASDQRFYTMPDGFAGDLTSAGGISYSGANKSYAPIKVTSIAHLNRLLSQESDSTGYPRYVAVRPKSDRGVSEQTWEIGFHPTPDAAYEFQYQAYMEPFMLTDDRPYPLGGQSHAQGILLSCLAAAEMYEFDQHGVHHEAFLSQLRADISKDARRAPATLGYGGVHRRGGTRGRPGRNSIGVNTSRVTYNDQHWD